MDDQSDEQLLRELEVCNACPIALDEGGMRKASSFGKGNVAMELACTTALYLHLGLVVGEEMYVKSEYLEVSLPQ